MTHDDRSHLPVAARVVAVTDLTPRMRRVTFAGPEVEAYLSGRSVPNVKLYFPRPDGRLDLPERAGHRYTWQPGQRERVRTYTVRRVHPDGSAIDVDLVRHGDAGLASAWVERARVGDRLGLLGGGGLVPGLCDWLLLVADETGLPAAAAILEALPATTRGVALLEVADAAEEQVLAGPAGVQVRWLHRDGAPPGTTTLLQDAMAGVEIPGGGGARVWVSAESQVVRFARRHLRALGFDRRRQLVIGYWHRGLSEVAYAVESDHDRADGELEVEAAAALTP